MATVDDLLDQWEEARERGEHISPQRLCQDHPELLAEVTAQIEVLLRFDSSFGFPLQTNSSRGHERPRAFDPPTELSLNSRYRLEGCHAVGGLGQVFLAFDEVLKRRVAIKFPRQTGMTAQQVARFEQEACITGQLDHPGIVPIHAMATNVGSEPCYVMRFVEGRTLDEAVRSARTRFPEENSEAYFQSEDFRRLLQSLITVCNTVAFAHDRKILHRDIKPNNILIGPFGETLLLDWGIAKSLKAPGSPSSESAIPDSAGGSEEYDKQIEPRIDNVNPSVPMHDGSPRARPAFNDSPMLTEPGHSLGTPAYASPEQLLGRAESAGFASDIYSIGSTLFFVMTGKSPLELLGWADYLQQIQKNKLETGRLLSPLIPAALRAICEKCLQLNPAQRYQSAQTLAADLDSYLAGNSVSVLRDSLWVQWVRRARRHPTITGGLITGFIVLGTAGAIGTAIVGGKNQQLSSTNTLLEGALKDSREANTIAMASLRSMVHESVSQRMAQREELSDSDRNYVRSILQQYLALSALQGDTEQTLAIRAEAEGQVGRLCYHLYQHADAIIHLRQAQSLYRQLRDLRQNREDVIAAAGYTEILASVLLSETMFTECRDSSDEAIALLNSSTEPAIASINRDDELNIASSLANLLFLRAEAHQRLGAHDKSLQDFRQAASLLQEMMAARPDDVSLKFAAGNNLRTFASYLNDRATSDNEYLEALNIANQAVASLEVAAQKNSDVFRFPSALAWAYYDRSFVLESLGRLDDAISDMWKSVDLTQMILTRFPLMDSNDLRLSGVIARRCRLFLKAGKVEDAYEDARRISDLKLTRVGYTRGIELLRQCLEADRDQTLDHTDAICHIAHLHAQRGRVMRAEGDLESALTDIEESLKQMASLAESPVPVLYRSFEYLWSLERIEILLQLRRFDQARPFVDEAANRHNAVRNLYDDSQREAIDRQLDSFRSQLNSSN